MASHLLRSGFYVVAYDVSCENSSDFFILPNFIINLCIVAIGGKMHQAQFFLSNCTCVALTFLHPGNLENSHDDCWIRSLIIGFWLLAVLHMMTDALDLCFAVTTLHEYVYDPRATTWKSFPLNVQLLYFPFRSTSQQWSGLMIQVDQQKVLLRKQQKVIYKVLPYALQICIP